MRQNYKQLQLDLEMEGLAHMEETRNADKMKTGKPKETSLLG
jgi:hypothetical protein